MSDTTCDLDELWELPVWVGPGARFKKNFGPTNPNTAVYHVLAIVDDDMIVMKKWMPRRKRWAYMVEPPLFITYGRQDIIEIQKVKDAS